MKNTRHIKLICFFLILLGSLIFPHHQSLSYTLSMTEEMEKLPLEEQEKIINAQNEAAGEEQLKVAQERFDRRIETKQQIASFLEKEARERRRVIMNQKIDAQKEETRIENFNTILSTLLFGIFIALAAYVFYMRNKKTKNI